MFLMSSIVAFIFAFWIAVSRFGVMIMARMAMMATTIISSISENPLFFLLIRASL